MIFRIVIVDEAHNVEQVCEESMSLSLTSTDLAGAIRECDEVANVVEGGVGLDTETDPDELDKVRRTTYDFKSNTPCLLLRLNSLNLTPKCKIF